LRHLVRAFAPALLVWALPALALAETIAPRPVVEHVAKLIEETYVHVDTAKSLATGLRADAAAGKFDALTDPRDLATALSDRLKKSDQHFNVVYDPSAPPSGGPRPAPTPSEVNEFNGMRRQSNWGFRRVEILPGNIGYIDMSDFEDIDPDDPTDPAKRAADAALRFVSGTDAVIFDMRDNGGGSPRMVGYLVSAFTPEGADIYNTFHTRGESFDEKPKSKLVDPPRTTVPLYVLTSARTGSAAEAFPYTLQTAGRAKIVGERTGGAANPGGYFPAGDRFAVFISTGEPINPINHKNWEGTGVVPDIATPQADALRAAQIDALKTIKVEGPFDKARLWALAALERPETLTPASPLTDYAGAYGARIVAVENGRLAVHRDRWPALVLLPLGGDTFTVEGHPQTRITFERNDQGKLIGFSQGSFVGAAARFARTPEP
jgi:hypothetical protein